MGKEFLIYSNEKSFYIVSVADKAFEMERVIVDSRWVGDHGIGRFAREVISRIPSFFCVDLKLSPVSPIDAIYLSFKIFFSGKSFWFSPGYNAPLMCRERYIFTIHDLNHVDLEYNSSFLKRCYYHFVMRPACKRAARVLTVSEFSRNRIIQWAKIPAEKVVNVGNGVSESFRQEGTHYEPGYRYILCVGNRKAHKNEVRIIQAFAISGIQSDVRLVFTGQDGAGLGALAHALGLSERVTFLGRIPENGLPAIYRGAIALIFPSLYEGFGLPVIEAMAVGTPVLTSTVTSLPEVAGDAAVLVDPLDERAIAAGIRRLVEDEPLRQLLIERGYRQAAKYTWDAVATRVATVLDEVTEALEKK